MIVVYAEYLHIPKVDPAIMTIILYNNMKFFKVGCYIVCDKTNYDNLFTILFKV